MINPENAIDEANEDDNVYELTVEWLAPASAAAEPTTYAGEDLGSIRPVRRPAGRPTARAGG